MATMEKIIVRAKGALDVAAKKDKFIPHFVWRDCKGVAIISVVQAGFAIAVSGGDGVLLKHNDEGTWGPPSALEFGGSSAGAIFGKADKQIFVFAMTEYSLSMLTSNTRYQLGVEIGLAVGPHGEEAEVGATAGGRGLGSTLTYTFQEGILLNIGYNNYFVGNVDKINNAFYGKEVDATDIVLKDGAVDVPEGRGVEDLHKKLGDFSKAKTGVETKNASKVETNDTKKHHKKNKHTMETILEHANGALDIAVETSKFIPKFVWKDCKGVAIISVREVGFAIAKSNGDGVLLKHNADGSWGPPSALEFGGTSAGAIFGKGKKQIFIFPMNEYGLSLLTSNTRYQLGVELGLAIGPHGGEAEAGATAGGRGMGSTLTFTFENGVLLDVGCNNYFVENKESINNIFYGKEVSPTDLVMKAGAVDIPDGTGIEDLHKKLGDLSGETNVTPVVKQVAKLDVKEDETAVAKDDAKPVAEQDVKPVAKEDVKPPVEEVAKPSAVKQDVKPVAKQQDVNSDVSGEATKDEKKKKKKHHKHHHHHHHHSKERDAQQKQKEKKKPDESDDSEKKKPDKLDDSEFDKYDSASA